MTSFPSRLLRFLRGPDAPYLLILIAAAVLTHRNWFLSLDPIAVGDWGYEWPQLMRAFLGSPIAWMSDYNLGYYNAAAPAHWIDAAMGALSAGGTNYAIAERIFYFWPAALLPGITLFLFLRSFLDRLGATVGGLVYELNTAALFFGGAHLTHYMAYGLAPLLFLFARSAWERTSFRTGVVFGLTAALTIAYEVRYAYILAWGVLAYLAFLVIRANARPTWANLRVLAVMVLVPAAIHAYWLLAFALYPASALSPLPAGLFTPFITLPYSLSLFNPFWSGGLLANFDVQPLPWFAFLLPVVAFAALLRKRVSGELLFWATISLIGVFLAKQNNPPAGSIYSWLYAHFPGFVFFRESSKFYVLTALGYGALAGRTAMDIRAHVVKVRLPCSWPRLSSRGQLAAATLAVALVTAGVIAPSQAAFANTLGYAYDTRPVPPLYQQLESLINHDAFSRVLWFLTYPTFGFRSNDHPAVDALAFFTQYHDALLRNATVQYYLDAISIEYVILANDTSYPGDQSLDFLRTWYTLVTTNASLRPVGGFPDTEVFLNPGAFPLLYGTDAGPSQLSDPAVVVQGAVQGLDVMRTGTNAYTVLLRTPVPRVLVLSEGYDPNWVLTAGTQTIVSVPVLGMVNGFILDGVKTSQVQISYRAQQIFDPLSVVSVFAIVAALAYAIRPRELIRISSWLRRRILRRTRKR